MDTNVTDRTTTRGATTGATEVDITAAGATGGNRFAGGWGPVLTGAVSAFLAFAVLSSLWLAIAGSGVDFISNNFGWWELLSAAVAAPFGGYVAGRLQPSGDRMTAGLQGFASWGLLILAGLFVGIPSGAELFSGATNLTLQGATDASANLAQFNEQLWAAFAVFAGGALLAAMGGAAAARTGHHHTASRDGHGDRRVAGDGGTARR